jgi:hypothetical protein
MVLVLNELAKQDSVLKAEPLIPLIVRRGVG